MSKYKKAERNLRKHSGKMRELYSKLYETTKEFLELRNNEKDLIKIMEGEYKYK